MSTATAQRPYSAVTYERIAIACANLRALSQDVEPLARVTQREGMRMYANVRFMTAKSLEAATADDFAKAAINSLKRIAVDKHRIRGIQTSSLGNINYGLARLGSDCRAFALAHEVEPTILSRLTAAIDAYVATGMDTGSYAGV